MVYCNSQTLAGTMANNKDFFLELRKQVTDMQQAERTGG